jgi:hypothetical protein
MGGVYNLRSRNPGLFVRNYNCPVKIYGNTESQMSLQCPSEGVSTCYREVNSLDGLRYCVISRVEVEGVHLGLIQAFSWRGC